MNDDFETLQKLIVLKRFEQPPEDFVEDFMREFHVRQREEANRRTSVELFWEKVGRFFDRLSGPAWATVGAAAALVVASLVGMNDSTTAHLPSIHGLKPVDYKETAEDAAFKAFPIILGDGEASTSPAEEAAKKKEKETGKPTSPVGPVPQK
jgi:hypothetical protein